jgi:hypothetical protein
MTRKIARFARFIGDYRFYREKGYDYKTSWDLASMTIP